MNAQTAEVAEENLQAPEYPVSEGTLLSEPSEEQFNRSNIARYLGWLERNRGLRFDSYHDLWAWSTGDLEAFWSSVWDFFEVRSHTPIERVLSGPTMPGARWFQGAQLNYAERALSRRDDHLAVIAHSETRPPEALSYSDLYRRTAACTAGLRRLGVRRGDRVVAFMPNIAETVVAFLASASIGAIWSSCPPELGIRSVVDRFRQIGPKVLIAVDGYQYRGAHYDCLPQVAELQRALPTLEATVLVPYLSDHPTMNDIGEAVLWPEMITKGEELSFEPVPFEHPLWVLYTSGTTGLPKAIVQGHGGILLEHLKALSLHLDLNDADRFFWYTSTGWMMWNFLIGGLLLGATVLLYDGHPGHPDMRTLWRFAQETGMTYFGTSAPYIHACMKAGIEPGGEFDLTRLKGLGSTGSPLSPEGFQWVGEKVNRHLLLNSFSGGTDLCTGIVGSCPILPVYAGEISCRLLGAPVEAYDGQGHSVVNEVGELVITGPMPSMPLFLWNDANGQRYRESYFEMFPGVWRHGDWIKITDRGSCIISGRSDSTLNRVGVRMGTSEFYRVVEDLEEVADSLVVDTGHLGTEDKLLLFVVLRTGVDLDERLRSRITRTLREQLSPRYAPDEIHAIPEVPYTLNGKKMEVPVKRILRGAPLEEVVSPDAMSNPDSLGYFSSMAGNVSG